VTGEGTWEGTLEDVGTWEGTWGHEEDRGVIEGCGDIGGHGRGHEQDMGTGGHGRGHEEDVGVIGGHGRGRWGTWERT